MLSTERSEVHFRPVVSNYSWLIFGINTTSWSTRWFPLCCPGAQNCSIWPEIICKWDTGCGSQISEPRKSSHISVSASCSSRLSVRRYRTELSMVSFWKSAEAIHPQETLTFPGYSSSERWWEKLIVLRWFWGGYFCPGSNDTTLQKWCSTFFPFSCFFQKTATTNTQSARHLV